MELAVLINLLGSIAVEAANEIEFDYVAVELPLLYIYCIYLV